MVRRNCLPKTTKKLSCQLARRSFPLVPFTRSLTPLCNAWNQPKVYSWPLLDHERTQWFTRIKPLQLKIKVHYLLTTIGRWFLRTNLVNPTNSGWPLLQCTRIVAPLPSKDPITTKCNAWVVKSRCFPQRRLIHHLKEISIFKTLRKKTKWKQSNWEDSVRNLVFLCKGFQKEKYMTGLCVTRRP